MPSRGRSVREQTSSCSKNETTACLPGCIQTPSPGSRQPLHLRWHRAAYTPEVGRRRERRLQKERRFWRCISPKLKSTEADLLDASLRLFNMGGSRQGRPFVAACKLVALIQCSRNLRPATPACRCYGNNFALELDSILKEIAAIRFGCER